MNLPVQHLYPLELNVSVGDLQLVMLSSSGTILPTDAVSVLATSSDSALHKDAVLVPSTPTVPVAAPSSAVVRPAKCVGTSKWQAGEPPARSATTTAGDHLLH